MRVNLFSGNKTYGGEGGMWHFFCCIFFSSVIFVTFTNPFPRDLKVLHVCGSVCVCISRHDICHKHHKQCLCKIISTWVKITQSNMIKHKVMKVSIQRWKLAFYFNFISRNAKNYIYVWFEMSRITLFSG